MLKKSIIPYISQINIITSFMQNITKNSYTHKQYPHRQIALC